MGVRYREFLTRKKDRPGSGAIRPRRTQAEVERAAAIREYQRKKSAARSKAQMRLL